MPKIFHKLLWKHQIRMRIIYAGDEKYLPGVKSISSREVKNENFTGKDDDFTGGLI